MISSPDSRVLVVGGGGFLGRHVASALAQTGANVTVTCRRVKPGDRCIALDVISSSGADLRRAVESFDAVVNCTGKLVGSPDELARTNIIGPVRLMLAVADAAPTARFVQLGSAAEYGATGSDQSGVGESHATMPLSDYGFSKLAATAGVLAAAEDLNVDAVVLRVFNPIGSGSPTSTLAGRVAAHLRSVPGPTLQVGPLDAYRDFVDARDIASCVIACVQTESLQNRLYNVGSGKATMSRELVTALVRIAGYKGEINEDAPPSDRSGAVAWQRANIERAATELSWTPRFGLEDSLSELWRGLV